MSKKRKKYGLIVSYPAERYYSGYDHKIWEAANITDKEDTGSGMGFGVRDLEFTFASNQRRVGVVCTLKRRFRGLKFQREEDIENEIFD